MKSTLKIFFLLIVLISVVACNAQSTSLENQTSNEEATTMSEVSSTTKDANHKKRVVLYMRAHDLSGLEKSTKSDAYYYRVLIKKLSKERYLVQDFFISGKKLTDPYILTDGKLEYTDNEDVTHLNNYYPIEGARIVWSESGNKEIETHYENNMPTDTWIEYFENGQKKSENHYKDGVLHGISKIWNEQGVLTGECSYDHGIKNGRCYAKYSLSPDIYIYDFKYKNDKKTGVSKKWNIDGSIDEFTFDESLSLQEIKKSLKKDQFKIFTFDVTADGIDDLVISRVNGDSNLYQGDELYVLKGNSDSRYKLILSTSNYTDEAGWFLYDIFPKANNSGFILKNYFATRGNSNQTFYFEKVDNEFVIMKYVSDGTHINGEDYYCIENDKFDLSEKEYGKSSSYSDEQFKSICPPPTNDYKVIAGKAEILSEDFESRSPPNYYIRGDLIEAFDQNEDWVKVSYKNGTKFGWIDKRELVPD